MSETNAKPVDAENSAPGSDAAADLVVSAAPSSDGGALSSGEGSPNSLPPWMQRRLDAMTSKLRKEEEQHASLKQAHTLLKAAHDAMGQELARLRSGGAATGNGAQPSAGAGAQAQPVSAGAPALTSEEVERLVQQETDRRLAAQNSAQAENESVERGRSLYADFDAQVSNLKKLGGLEKNTLQLILDTGSAEHILYALGSDLNKASDVLAMPLGKMALELSKLAQKPGYKPDNASKAPAPITPLGGRAAAPAKDLADPKLTMAEWDRARAAQIEERKAGRR